MTDRILVPVDQSDPADRAFEHTIERYPDATITLLYVVSPPEARYLTGDERRFRPSFEEAVGEATAFLDTFVQRARSSGVEVEADYTLSYESGKTARAILDYLDDHDIDHVVMGSHGRTGSARVLLGSVAERVVRRAAVPVTIVR